MLVGDEVSCPGRDPTAAARKVKKVVEKTVEVVEATQGAKAVADSLQTTAGAAENETAQGRSKAGTEAREAATTKQKACYCICGLPTAPLGDRKGIGRMLEAECRSACVYQHTFPYGEYTCL